MQYGEDDLTFVSRLLSEVGIWFRFATDARLKIEVVEFYDDQSGYERGLTLPLRHPSGLFDGETEAVWGLNTAYSVVEKSVTTRDYNYRTATAEMMTEQHDATGGDNTTYGEAYHYADNFLQKGDKEAAESGAFYARIRHERYLNEQAILKGQSTSSLLMPGLEIRVQGDDAPAVFRKGVLITGVTASAARDRSYELTFTAIPYSERYGYRPALIPRPVMAGTLPARVTSTVKNDIYAHIDKDGRYRVNLDFDRDTWKPGYESLWAQDEARYEVRLEPRMALLTRSRQNAIYQNLTVPQIVEKILRERHQMRGQDFVFNLKSAYPSREQVMQYGEDDLTFVSRLLSEVGIWRERKSASPLRKATRTDLISPG